jgi:hypothetical protein
MLSISAKSDVKISAGLNKGAGLSTLFSQVVI